MAGGFGGWSFPLQTSVSLSRTFRRNHSCAPVMELAGRTPPEGVSLMFGIRFLSLSLAIERSLRRLMAPNMVGNDGGFKVFERASSTGSSAPAVRYVRRSRAWSRPSGHPCAWTERRHRARGLVQQAATSATIRSNEHHQRHPINRVREHAPRSTRSR